MCISWNKSRGHLHLVPALKTSGVTPPFTLTPGCSDAELQRR